MTTAGFEFKWYLRDEERVKLGLPPDGLYNAPCPNNPHVMISGIPRAEYGTPNAEAMHVVHCPDCLVAIEARGRAKVIAKLVAFFTCRCDAAYTSRGKHGPNCMTWILDEVGE